MQLRMPDAPLPPSLPSREAFPPSPSSLLPSLGSTPSTTDAHPAHPNTVLAPLTLSRFFTQVHRRPIQSRDDGISMPPLTNDSKFL